MFQGEDQPDELDADEFDEDFWEDEDEDLDEDLDEGALQAEVEAWEALEADVRREWLPALQRSPAASPA